MGANLTTMTTPVPEQTAIGFWRIADLEHLPRTIPPTAALLSFTAGQTCQAVAIAAARAANEFVPGARMARTIRDHFKQTAKAMGRGELAWQQMVVGSLSAIITEADNHALPRQSSPSPASSPTKAGQLQYNIAKELLQQLQNQPVPDDDALAAQREAEEEAALDKIFAMATPIKQAAPTLSPPRNKPAGRSAITTNNKNKVLLHNGAPSPSAPHCQVLLPCTMRNGRCSRHVTLCYCRTCAPLPHVPLLCAVGHFHYLIHGGHAKMPPSIIQAISTQPLCGQLTLSPVYPPCPPLPPNPVSLPHPAFPPPPCLHRLPPPQPASLVPKG
eukprot:1146114-Pelagomonas_calceolata.AAC.2